MKRFRNNCESMALYVVIIFLLGILIAKVFGHLSVDDTFTQIMAIVQIIAVMILSWIAGWKKGQEK